jgi:hypothetical protein
MMMVVMMPRRRVVHRLTVIHGSRANVIHRRLVVIDAASKVAIAENHAPAHARVGGSDVGAEQAANEQGCTNNLLHDLPP